MHRFIPFFVWFGLHRYPECSLLIFNTKCLLYQLINQCSQFSYMINDLMVYDFNYSLIVQTTYEYIFSHYFIVQLVIIIRLYLCLSFSNFLR